MANLQVKNIPDSLHDRLRNAARENHTTVGEIVLAAVERELRRLSFEARLATRKPVDLAGVNVTAEIEAARHERDDELHR